MFFSGYSNYSARKKRRRKREVLRGVRRRREGVRRRVVVEIRGDERILRTWPEKDL